MLKEVQFLRLASCVAVLLWACGGTPDTDRTGALEVTIVGLPAGVDADVTITGPDGFSRALTASAILELNPGSYTIAAVRVPAAPSEYVAELPMQTLTLAADDVERRKVLYHLHECAPYQPTVGQGTLAGSWADPNEEDTFVFVVPTDRGGGYVHFQLETMAPVVPGLTINGTGAVGGAILSGSAATTANEQKREVVFEAAPGQSYTAAMVAAFDTIDVQYPWDYEASWAFTSLIDCYEPNDTEAQAKAIPLGETIEAYGIAGYRTGDILSGAPETLDHYRFRLDEPASVTIAVTVVAANQLVRLVLLDATGAQVDGTVTADAVGALATFVTSELAADAWYTLRIDPEPETRVANLLGGDDVPAHFEQRYAVRITRTP